MSSIAANWLDKINLKVELIPEDRPNRPGTSIRPTHVTIHNTSNTNRGADANAHSRFVRYTGYYEHNGKKNWVSWHYTVDDRVAIRHLPDTEKGWHAGENGNAKSIAIEICMHQGINQPAANERAACLTAWLLNEHGLGVDAVVKHQHWTGKRCPALLISDAHWADFISMVKACTEAIKRSGDGISGSSLPDGVSFQGAMCWDDAPHDSMDVGH